jgi:hypothetical protein
MNKVAPREPIISKWTAGRRISWCCVCPHGQHKYQGVHRAISETSGHFFLLLFHWSVTFSSGLHGIQQDMSSANWLTSLSPQERSNPSISRKQRLGETNRICENCKIDEQACQRGLKTWIEIEAPQ